MRWAQTAGYGMAPNPALPNVFLAQAYDLNDPYRNDSCYGAMKCHDNSVAPPGGYGRGCDGYCASVKTTNWYVIIRNRKTLPNENLPEDTHGFLRSHLEQREKPPTSVPLACGSLRHSLSADVVLF